MQTVYISREKLDYLKNPEKYVLPPKGLEIPSKPKDLEYYINAKNGGYLSGLIPKDTARENILKELLLIRAKGM